MSVRATNNLIGDIVRVSALPGSPGMVAVSVDPEAKTVKTVWFADDCKGQSAEFPAAALDRVDAAAIGKPKKKAAK